MDWISSIESIREQESLGVIVIKRVCVNCGSNLGVDPSYAAMAQRLGLALVEWNYELVYGGAEVGLMGQLADTVLKAGGVAIGVIPKSLASKVSHRNLTRLHVVDSMHARKAMMFDLADAFIALPGGFGTLEEITELLTWAQIGLNSKPCGLINVNGYYDHLLAFLDNSVAEGFMRREHREMLLVADTPEALLDKMDNYHVPKVNKLIGMGRSTL